MKTTKLFAAALALLSVLSCQKEEQQVIDNSENEGGVLITCTFANNDAATKTLSIAEWTYLLNTRSVNSGTGEGKSYQSTTLTLSDNTTTVYGMILAPDNYTGSLSSATSWSDWQTMESAGCVFLPAAGQLYKSTGILLVREATIGPLSPMG